MDASERRQAINERIAEYAREVVKLAPPLTEAQKDQIRILFVPADEQPRRAS